MERTCSKCGTQNPTANGGELEECPACGAIYSRVLRAQALAATRQNVHERVGQGAAPARSVLGWIGLAVEVLAWLWVLLGAIFGALQLSAGLDAAESAPQQAAVAGMAAAMAVIPYCVARAVQHLRQMAAQG